MSMISDGIKLCDALGIACRHMTPLDLHDTVGKILLAIRHWRMTKPGWSEKGGVSALKDIKSMSDEERCDMRDGVLGVVVINEVKQ
jgi:hypothetical protein